MRFAIWSGCAPVLLQFAIRRCHLCLGFEVVAFLFTYPSFPQNVFWRNFGLYVLGIFDFWRFISR